MVLHLQSYQSYNLQKTLQYVIGVREASRIRMLNLVCHLHCSVDVLYRDMGSLPFIYFHSSFVSTMWVLIACDNSALSCTSSHCCLYGAIPNSVLNILSARGLAHSDHHKF